VTEVTNIRRIKLLMLERFPTKRAVVVDIGVSGQAKSGALPSANIST
jgi:hypothetical protein